MLYSRMDIILFLYDTSDTLVDRCRMNAIREYAKKDLLDPFIRSGGVMTTQDLREYAAALLTWASSQPPKDFPLHDMMQYRPDMDLMEWLLLVRSCYIDYSTKSWTQFLPSWRRLQEQMPRLQAADLHTDLTAYIIEKAAIVKKAAATGWHGKWSA